MASNIPCCDSLGRYHSDQEGFDAAQICQAITIDDIDFPLTIIGQFYVFNLTATDGINPITWSLASGALPAGMTLSDDGTIEGLVEATETASFTVAVTDAAGNVCTKDLEITVACPELTDTSPLPSGTVGVPYSFSLTSIPPLGTGWAVIAGALPGGLSLSVDGIISGTPTTPGDFSLTLGLVSVVCDKLFAMTIAP